MCVEGARVLSRGVSRMHRRNFIASGLGLVAGAAVQRLAWAAHVPKAMTAQAAAAAIPQGKWVSLAPFPEALEEVYGAAVDGKLYVFTGLIPVWKPAGVVYQYDPAANAWTKRKPMAHPLHHPAVSVLNGKVYFFGGFVLPESGPPGWVPINEAWEYTPGTDTWRALAPMPTKRGAAAAAEAGGKFHVVGAQPSSLPTPTCRSDRSSLTAPWTPWRSTIQSRTPGGPVRRCPRPATIWAQRH